MQHPEKLLRTSGIQLALRLLRERVRAFELGMPNFPRSSLLCQAAMGNPTFKSDERAATRELPYVLLTMQDLPVLWKMDESFAIAMLETDYPADHGLSGFRLPYPAVWVESPPILQIRNESSGLHDLEGFYLVEDWVPSRAKLMKAVGKDCTFSDLDDDLNEIVNNQYQKGLRTDPESVLERAVMVLVVGKSREPDVVQSVEVAGTRVNLPLFDDALISFWALTEDRYQLEEDPNLRRLVFNLLIALQSDYVQEDKISPHVPRGSRRRARAERKGESFAPYSVLRLGKRANTSRQASPRGEHSGPDRIIRGHWNYYWVLEQNVKDSVVITRRPREAEAKKALCKIRKWIQPVIIGNPAPKTYLLRK